MANRIDGLIEKRNRAWDAAKAILEGAGDEPLSAEQRSAYDAANAEIDILDGDIKAEVEAEKRNKAFDEIRSQRPTLVDPASPESRTGPEADKLLSDVRAFLSGEKRGLEVVREMPMTRNERRSLSRLTGASGNNTVKTSFYDQLIQALIVNSGLLSAGPNVLSTSSGEPIALPKVTANSSAALTAETAQIAASDPTFGQISLSAYKYASLVQISRELIEDTSVDLLGYLAMEMGRAVSNQAGVDFVVGNGSSKPRGILTDATLGVTGVTGQTVPGNVTADGLIDLYYSVIAPYRNSADAGWLMADATLGAVRKLKDTTGQYLWQPSLTAGAPDTLLGKPVHTDPNMPLVAVNAKSVLFGDISRYTVREVNQIRFEQSADFAFANDLVTFKAVWRADGALTDVTGAVKYFVGAAS